jgi:hypothetical protein
MPESQRKSSAGVRMSAIFVMLSHSAHEWARPRAGAPRGEGDMRRHRYCHRRLSLSGPLDRGRGTLKWIARRQLRTLATAIPGLWYLRRPKPTAAI